MKQWGGKKRLKKTNKKARVSVICETVSGSPNICVIGVQKKDNGSKKKKSIWQILVKKFSKLVKLINTQIQEV